MKLAELILERRLQHVSTMYHGTSNAHLQSILTHGLQPFMSHKSFGGYEFPSLGGVYLTNQPTIAHQAAEEATEVHGGDPIMITVQYVDTSGTVDEDIIFYTLVRIGLAIYVASGRHYNRGVQAAVVDKALKKIKNVSSVTWKTAALLPEFYDKMFHILNTSTDQWIRSFVASKNPSQIDEDLAADEIMKLPLMRDIMTRLLDTTRAKAATSPEVRVTRPIKFKGKTRILRIDNLKTGEAYYESPNGSVGLQTKNTRV